MRKECPYHPASGTITLTFEHCPDHHESKPVSAMVDYEGGVDITDVVDLALGALEESLARELGDFPPIHSKITREWPEIGVLPMRAQKHLVKLLAHQYLIQVVVPRAYHVHGESASMSLPRF